MGVQTDSVERRGLYPASFDPLTIAHVSIAERAAQDFGKLYIAAAVNPSKRYQFSLEEKLEFLEASLDHIPNAEIIALPGGLTVDHARRLGATSMIRGLRGVNDFSDEQELAAQNQYVQEAIGIGPGHPEYVDTQTYYALPDQNHISSKLVRGLMLMEDVEFREERIKPLVPAPVFDMILSQLRAREAQAS